MKDYTKEFILITKGHDQIYVLGTREVERTASRDSKSKDRKAGKILQPC